MSSGLNLVILIGNLGEHPKSRVTKTGKDVTEMRLATSEYWGGEKRTEWHQIVVWGDLAKTCANNLQKGALVQIEGAIRTRKWNSNEGVTNYTTEIIARRVNFLGRKMDP